MRRMYSKEQLQKLIDEVSRLIAIEELDKVVPVPSLDKAGYLMQVNSAGTGYQLARLDELVNVKDIYCHPIYCSFKRAGDEKLITFTCLIFNNTATPFTKSSFFSWALDLFSNYPNASILASGYAGASPASRIKAHTSSSISLETVNADASDNDYWSFFEIPESATFTDGVNKIN